MVLLDTSITMDNPDYIINSSLLASPEIFEVTTESSHTLENDADKL